MNKYLWMISEFKERLCSKRAYPFLVIFLLILVLAAHTLHLADIPTGLFQDETSIGYNAALISQYGIDEHGIHYPTYFKTFDDYKNPIYIYAAALVFKAFGISEFTLRFTSVIFYLASLTFTLLLVSKIFRRNWIIEIYTLVSFGFLPILFVLSRVSFELISQLTWFSAANLCIWMLFHEESRDKRSHFKALLCGIIIGTSIYTYSTARVLSFLMLVSLWVIYFSRKNIKTLGLITLTFSISLIPYVLFTINHPGAITERFRSISYLYYPISIFKKVTIFFANLATYWSPSFLTIHGDSNLRHSTGYGGIVFSMVLLLFLMGLANLIFCKKLNNQFSRFLIVNLLLAPIPASLTSEGTPHALRSLLFGYYMLLLSCYGVELLLEFKEQHIRRILIACIAIFLSFEISGYQLDYFLFYPSKSIQAMGSFDFKTSLQTAIDQNPQEIIFVNSAPTSYSNLRFYSYLVKNPRRITISMNDKPIPAPDHCILYNLSDEEKLNHFSYPFTQYSSGKKINILERFRGIEPAESIMKVRCY
ncbi:hypothetical protein J5X98_06740 [Leptothermofonsia sichuanensis E412]|uniref:ArnT family glycosyltransferase n=1 Tax=Leptothermofonsia sichuanensis TaxID=2917832 RepID=UPI001CA72D44|nr:hypothetical protein [Leptothermofonsia sichuanensis]QZZ22091.1 hypothetical protein J5X98_06740 [Leptothermofonsia sichuanensis E412]